MGLLDKIEAKLTGSSNADKAEKQVLQKQSGADQTGTSSLQHPIQGATTSSGKQSTSSGLQNPASSTATSGLGQTNTPGQSAGLTSSTAGQSAGLTSSTAGQSAGLTSSTAGYGSETAPYKTQAAQPYDPYSSRGQRIAAGAIPDRTVGGTSGTGASDARDYAAGTSADDSGVTRSRLGGVTNSMENPTGLRSGPHPELENHDAIPTAGGEKVGRLGSNDKQHHFGRDAAIGGVGAAGVGAYEAEKHHHGRQARDEYDPQDQRQHHHLFGHHTGAASGVGAAGVGTAGVGAYEAEKHHHHHQGNDGRGQLPENYAAETHAPRPDGNNGAFPEHQQHHFGRDTAIAGGVGAAGVGAYEAEKHHHNRQGVQGQGFQGQGSHLPHPDGNNDAFSHHQQHHFGRDTAIAGGVGAAGVGAYEAEKHHHNRKEAEGQSSQGQSSHLPHPDGNNDAFTHHSQHHFGRDTAIAGGVGATGVGAYEAEKHHHNRKEAEGQGFSGQGSSSAPRYQNDLSSGSQSSAGQDVSYMNKPLPGTQSATQGQRSGEYGTAAGIGAAGIGAAGLGAAGLEHEHNKQAGQSGGLAGHPGAKKMGGAYEAGYEAGWRDALEHAKLQTRS